MKVIRFGQHRIQKTGAGILAFITNNGYLDNPTFRGMRQQLMNDFTEIYLLDLHGNSRMQERAPDGGPDQNVFDIQQGVSIAIFVKENGKPGPATVHHSELWGTREVKYKSLSELDISTTSWTTLTPESPDYRFKPWSNILSAEYRQWPAISEIMAHKSTGIVTSRDNLAIRWDPNEVIDVVADFAELPPEVARSKYGLPADGSGWRIQWAQSDVKEAGLKRELVAPIL